MLHEILLALWGHSTGIERILESDPSKLHQYLHVGECALITKILQFAKEVNNIRNFIRNNRTLDDNPHQKGLYLAALCDGMDKTLEPFREDIVDMERIILSDAYTPLTMILCRIQKYLSLFSVLNRIIREIKTQQLHGCKILQCLHQHSRTGIPEVKKALEEMTHAVHVIFYKHLTSWLLYGRLEDTYNEFFIQKTDKSNAMVMSEETDKDLEKDKDRETSLTKCTTQFSNELWDYEVNFEILPYYIRPSLATKILTIGQTIIMFSNDPRNNNDLSSIRNTETLIWGEKEYEYFEKLRLLQGKPTFALVEFERTVDQFKMCVTQHLWHVAVEEVQLINRLKLIKDFYLMGRGDMFLEFIKLATDILDKMPTNYTSRDINLVFQVALRKTYSGDENALESFTFAVPLSNSEKDNTLSKRDHNSTDRLEFSERELEDPIEKKGWGLIILKHRITWPLQLLFNPVTLHNYNALFRFLLRIKKTQINLWNLWREHRDAKNVDIGIIELRNKLIFIIDNLQYYLQVDVIESQYTVMINSIKNTRNFEDVQKAHAIFLADIMSRTFLITGDVKKNPVNKLIQLLLRLCDDFICNASVWNDGRKECLLETEKIQLKSLNDVMNGLMGWLNKTLNKVRAQPSGDHLAQLLLRLNYNKWFTNKEL